MPHPLQDLKRLLTDSAPARGTVLEVLPTGIRVSTAQGIQTAARQVGDATHYKPGDVVRLFNGSVLGRSMGGDAYVV